MPSLFVASGLVEIVARHQGQTFVTLDRKRSDGARNVVWAASRIDPVTSRVE